MVRKYQFICVERRLYSNVYRSLSNRGVAVSLSEKRCIWVFLRYVYGCLIKARVCQSHIRMCRIMRGVNGPLSEKRLRVEAYNVFCQSRCVCGSFSTYVSLGVFASVEVSMGL